MKRAVRILLSIAVALVAGITAQLALSSALGHGLPSGSLIIFLAYLIGGLPGLLFDPILLVIEGTAFAIVYNILPKAPEARMDEQA